jgi:hypothetical protein
MNIRKKNIKKYSKIFTFITVGKIVNLKVQYTTDGKTGVCVKVHRNGDFFDQFCYKGTDFQNRLKEFKAEDVPQLIENKMMKTITQVYKISSEDIEIFN